MILSLLLSVFIVGTYSIEPFEPNYLMTKIREKDKNIKYHLLNQYVALAWGYKNFNQNYTANNYLEEMAEFVLDDYMLTTKQKINSFIVRYILTIYGKAIFSQQHITAAENLIRLKLQNNGVLVDDLRKLEYEEEMNKVSEFSLTEGEIAMDLLIQAFAPASLATKKYVKGNDLSNYRSQQYTIIRRRAAGAYVIVNSLLDPYYRLKFNDNFALSTTPEIILKYLEKQAWLNFEKYSHPTKNKPWNAWVS
ncbi:hypothetical protein ILUMI_21680 [Ignelater luminosus]|uniref:Uncharacterized protein n=1 Tax=Ignelater luminosus TaxID=2038154 RepID=A0A8K0CBZ3_IGNLU|nr:hypothetical protein ILUMI_21680 [Ignelater luminosus]